MAKAEAAKAAVGTELMVFRTNVARKAQNRRVGPDSEVKNHGAIVDGLVAAVLAELDARAIKQAGQQNDGEDSPGTGE